MHRSSLTNEIISLVKNKYEEISSIREVAKELNKVLGTSLTYHNVRDIINGSIELQDGIEATKNLDGFKYTITTNKDGGAELDIKTNKRIKSLQDLIDQCSIDLSLYEIEKHIINKRDVISKNADGEAEPTEAFQVKAFLKPKTGLNLLDIKEEIKEELKKYSPKVEKFEVKKFDNPVMLEIAPQDIHFNKYASKETSGDDYSMDIAKQRLSNAIEDTLMYAKGFNIEKVVLVLGSDMFNIDSGAITTTGGTLQNTQILHREAVKEIRQYLTNEILKLSNTLQCAIDVVVIPGNHDFNTSFHIADSLECFFHNNENINIDNGLKSRKYYEYGDNCICFTHGEEKESSLPLIALQEMRKLGITAENVEIHKGHLHKRKQMNYVGVDENTGIVQRILSSLTGTDDRHFNKGFVLNRKAMDSFIWHKEQGLIANFNIKGR